MRFKLYKDISEGGKYPKCYGVAWRSHRKGFTRCYPIPINLIVRAWKDFYYWLMKGCWHSKYERELLKAYFDGMCDRRGQNER